MRYSSSLKRIESTLNLVLAEMTLLSSHTKSRVSDEGTTSIVHWIFSSPYDGALGRLETALKLRLPGTGTWLLQCPAYQDWLQSRSGVIWLTGPAGSRKTLLCAMIVENLLSRAQTSSAVLYFFCEYHDPSTRTLEGFLMSTIKQLLDMSRICREAAEEFRQIHSRSSGSKFDRSRCLELLSLLLSKFEEVSIIVDALDEASEGLRIISALLHMQKSNVRKRISVRVLFLSRRETQLERQCAVEGIKPSCIVLAEENIHHDLERFLNRS